VGNYLILILLYVVGLFKIMKKRLNHKKYIEILKKMSPEQKLLKMFELSEYSKKLFWYGLKNKYPDLADDKLKKIYLEKLIKCHNRNY
jgi:hypothetical protein